METTKTDNELIAEFMGFTQDEKEDRMSVPKGEDLKFRAYTILKKNLKYDTSWDWLMPVVQKIENMGVSTKIDFNGISTEVRIGSNITVWENPSTKIAKVYKAVTDFIKWYNQQTVTPKE